MGPDRERDLRGLGRVLGAVVPVEQLSILDRLILLPEAEPKGDRVLKRQRSLLHVLVLAGELLVPLGRLVIHRDRLPVAADLVNGFASKLRLIEVILRIEENL